MWSLFIYQNWIRKLPLSHIPVPMYSSILSITLLVILSIKYSCSPTVLFNQSSQLDYYIVQISREFDRKEKRLCRQLTSFAQSDSRKHELLKKFGASKSQLSMVGWFKTPPISRTVYPDSRLRPVPRWNGSAQCTRPHCRIALLLSSVQWYFDVQLGGKSG